MKRLFAIFLPLLIAINITSQTPSAEAPINLPYSELFAERHQYLGKLVRVSANYIYGFEWAFLCGDEGDCRKRKTDTWVEFIDEDDLCKGSKSKLKNGSNKFDNRADVVFVGRLSSGGFGHFGSYEYQFTVSCVEKFRKLPILR